MQADLTTFLPEANKRFSLCESFNLRENTAGTEFRNNSILRCTERGVKHTNYTCFKVHSSKKIKIMQKKKAPTVTVK